MDESHYNDIINNPKLDLSVFNRDVTFSFQCRQCKLMKFMSLPKRPLIAIRELDIQHIPSLKRINRHKITPFRLVNKATNSTQFKHYTQCPMKCKKTDKEEKITSPIESVIKKPIMYTRKELLDIGEKCTKTTLQIDKCYLRKRAVPKLPNKKEQHFQHLLEKIKRGPITGPKNL